uniref:Uncharacterized protein n=1 Tax=Arion vulgaris TaxID=1028688 RepID=A0A0B7B227_9EUPU
MGLISVMHRAFTYGVEHKSIVGSILNSTSHTCEKKLALLPLAQTGPRIGKQQALDTLMSENIQDTSQFCHKDISLSWVVS